MRLNQFIMYLDNDFDFNEEFPFNKIYLYLENNYDEECIEYVVSMMMEPYDDIVSPLIKKMSSEEERYFNIPTDRTVSDLKTILEEKYSEILKIDFLKKENQLNFWFISKNKEEPRLANRFDEVGSDLEQPLAIARDIKKLYDAIKSSKNNLKISEFLSQNSDLRHVVRRAFIVKNFHIQKYKIIQLEKK